MKIPVISTAASVADGPDRFFAIARPGGDPATGLRGHGVWVCEVEDRKISRQLLISLPEARALLAVLANPAIPGFLLLGSDETEVMRRAISGAVDTFAIPSGMSRAEQPPVPEAVTDQQNVRPLDDDSRDGRYRLVTDGHTNFSARWHNQRWEYSNGTPVMATIIGIGSSANWQSDR